MSKPLISIVTISYNQRQYLQQAIESVLSQKSEDIEYIVVDAGSTDGSLDLISAYGDKIDHVLSGPDNGPADGLNKGFARASGKVGYFLNSDDFLMPHSIQAMQQFWTGLPRANVLMCGGWMVDRRGLPLRELHPTGRTLHELLNGSRSMMQQGLSFRLDAFRKINGFNVANRTCWDLELLCGLLQLGTEAVVLPSRIGAFRLHEDSLTGGAAGERHQAKYEEDFARLKHEFGVEAESRTNWPRLINATWHLVDRLLPSRMAKRFEADCGNYER